MEHEPTLKEDLEAMLRELGLEPEPVIEEFDLLSISDEAAFLSLEMAKKVKERIVGFAQLVEEILQPDSGLAAMNECSFFSEKEHDKLVKTYRELMSLVRRFTSADVEGTKAAYKAFVKDAMPRWQAQKEWLSTVAQKLHDDWKKAQPLHREHEYLG